MVNVAKILTMMILHWWGLTFSLIQVWTCLLWCKTPDTWFCHGFMVIEAELNDFGRIPEHESFPPVADDIIQESTSIRRRKKKKAGKFSSSRVRGLLLPFLGRLAPWQAQPKPQRIPALVFFFLPVSKGEEKSVGATNVALIFQIVFKLLCKKKITSERFVKTLPSPN